MTSKDYLLMKRAMQSIQIASSDTLRQFSLNSKGDAHRSHSSNNVLNKAGVNSHRSKSDSNSNNAHRSSSKGDGHRSGSNVKGGGKSFRRAKTCDSPHRMNHSVHRKGGKREQYDSKRKRDFYNRIHASRQVRPQDSRSSNLRSADRPGTSPNLRDTIQRDTSPVDRPTNVSSSGEFLGKGVLRLEAPKGGKSSNTKSPGNGKSSMAESTALRRTSANGKQESSNGKDISSASLVAFGSVPGCSYENVSANRKMLSFSQKLGETVSASSSASSSTESMIGNENSQSILLPTGAAISINEPTEREGSSAPDSAYGALSQPPPSGVFHNHHFKQLNSSASTLDLVPDTTESLTTYSLGERQSEHGSGSGHGGSMSCNRHLSMKLLGKGIEVEELYEEVLESLSAPLKSAYSQFGSEVNETLEGCTVAKARGREVHQTPLCRDSSVNAEKTFAFDKSHTSHNDRKGQRSVIENLNTENLERLDIENLEKTYNRSSMAYGSRHVFDSPSHGEHTHCNAYENAYFDGTIAYPTESANYEGRVTDGEPAARDSAGKSCHLRDSQGKSCKIMESRDDSSALCDSQGNIHYEVRDSSGKVYSARDSNGNVYCATRDSKGKICYHQLDPRAPEEISCVSQDISNTYVSPERYTSDPYSLIAKPYYPSAPRWKPASGFSYAKLEAENCSYSIGGLSNDGDDGSGDDENEGSASPKNEDDLIRGEYLMEKLRERRRKHGTGLGIGCSIIFVLVIISVVFLSPSLYHDHTKPRVPAGGWKSKDAKTNKLPAKETRNGKDAKTKTRDGDTKTRDDKSPSKRFLE